MSFIQKMRRTLTTAVRRTRSLLQRAPMVGTIAGEMSLAEHFGNETNASSVTIFEAETVVSRCPLAIPTELVYVQEEKRVWILNDVTVWPSWGVAIDERSRLVRETVFSAARLDSLRHSAIFRHFPYLRCEGLATVIEIGSAWDNHYHWLVDVLPRVFALHDPRITALGTIRLFVAGAAQPEREQLLRALLPPNVEVVRVSPRVRIRAEKFLLLPFLAGDCAGYLPAEYVQFFRARAFTAFDSLPSEPPKRRLLISRRLAAKRQFANQSDLDERLGTLGFESVELESLSLADQIELFSQAEVVVAAHGAGLTNLLFATDCKVLEVFLNDRPLAHYRWLARALGHEYANILGANTEKNANAAAPIEAIVARLAELGIQ